MKNPSARFLLALLVAALSVVERSATAQLNQYWDPLGLNASPGSGGTGTWSTGTNWWVSGSSDSTWTNNNFAIFAGTSGTVTLGANATANGLTFIPSSYTISGSSTLTLAGTPAITLPAGTNTITCAVASTVPVSFTGPGTLNLTHSGGNSGLTGGTTIDNGTTVAITSTVGLGSGTITDNGTVNITVGASSFIAPITGSGTWNVNIPYSTGSLNIRYALSSLASFSGIVNLIAGLSGGNPGAGQIIMTNNVSSSMTWNIGVGATLDLAPTLAGDTHAANVIVNGPGNSQPYGALRLDACKLTGNVLLNGPGITIGDYNNTVPSEISGIISDNGHGFGFSRVVNRGTIILSGANTYTGPTIVSAGKLQVGSAETPGASGPLGASPASNPGSIVLSGGTLQYSSANQNDYSGRFSTNASQACNIDLNGQAVTFATGLTSSGGSLTLSDSAGSGVLTLSAANTYNGITTINSGTLKISGSLAGTVLTVNGGGLELDNPAALPAGTVLTLPASPADGTVNLNFSGTQTITMLNFGSTPMPSGTYGSATNPDVQYPSSAFTGNGILNVQPPTYWDPALSATAPGSGGNGSWDNTSANWLIGTSDTRWVSNNIANFAGTPGTVTVNADVTADGLNFISSGYILGGTSTLTLGGTPIVTLAGGAAEIDCAIAGSAGLAETGSGALTLGGANTFTGATAIGSGCALVLSGGNAFTGPMTIGAAGSLAISGAGNLAGGAYPGNIANSGGAIIYNASAPQTLSGIISGSGALTQQGPGPLTLSGLNTFTGPIAIDSGTLTIAGSGDLGNNITFNTGNYAGGIANNGAFVYSSSTAQTLSGDISGLGTLTHTGSGTLTLSAFNGYTGGTTIGAGSTLIISGSGALGYGDYEAAITNNGALTCSSSSSQTLGGPISGTGSLTFNGSGILALAGTNTYTGPTTISAGMLTLGSSGSLGNSPLSIAAWATFDVSAVSSPYVFSSASFSATGTANAAAAINGPAGGVVDFGSAPISLTFAPQTFSGDAGHPALSVNQGDLTLNGNGVAVRNAGRSALGAGTYALVQVASGIINGSATLVGGVSGAGVARDCAALLGVSGGSLNLVVTPVPVINSVSLSGADFILSGTNGSSGGTYYVLTSTNVALPLSQWTSIATNTFGPAGEFAVTNAVGTDPTRFFSIETSPAAP